MCLPSASAACTVPPLATPPSACYSVGPTLHRTPQGPATAQSLLSCSKHLCLFPSLISSLLRHRRHNRQPQPISPRLLRNPHPCPATAPPPCLVCPPLESRCDLHGFTIDEEAVAALMLGQRDTASGLGSFKRSVSALYVAKCPI
jgi:hypothetical protein